MFNKIIKNVKLFFRKEKPKQEKQILKYLRQKSDIETIYKIGFLDMFKSPKETKGFSFLGVSEEDAEKFKTGELFESRKINFRDFYLHKNNIVKRVETEKSE